MAARVPPCRFLVVLSTRVRAERIWASEEFWEFCGFGELVWAASREGLKNPPYWVSVAFSRTTSESVCSRSMAMDLPSGDQWNIEIRSAEKFVIWRPGEPSSGWSQRFSTPVTKIE
jgi:hypothetical protein